MRAERKIETETGRAKASTSRPIHYGELGVCCCMASMAWLAAVLPLTMRDPGHTVAWQLTHRRCIIVQPGVVT